MVVAVELSDAVLRDLQMTPAELDQEVRLMAAARLYERGLVSTGQAAERVQVPRSLLLSRLADFGVSISDPSIDELRKELENARAGC